jgi:hypothetical protein
VSARSITGSTRLRQSFSPTRALGWTGCRGVFYAPPIDHYVISRYADVEAIFREAMEILLEGGHRPQPSMVSLDPLPIRGFGWGRPAPDEQVEQPPTWPNTAGYLRGVVAAKASDRGDDLMSALREIHDEAPDQLTHEEIASILFSLSFAGYQTTNNLLGTRSAAGSRSRRGGNPLLATQA